MSEIALAEDAGQVQERGVPAAAIRRGVLQRFLPASAASMGSVAAVLSMGSGGLSIPQLLLLGLEVIGLTFGFGLGLTALKRFLYSDAAVDHRRSILAGLCSPLYLMLVSFFSQGSSLAEIAGWSTLTGVGVALALFFPWLSQTPNPEGEGLLTGRESSPGLQAGPTGEEVGLR